MNSDVRVGCGLSEFNNLVDLESFKIESQTVENLVAEIENVKETILDRLINVEETILERFKNVIKPSRVCLQKLPCKLDNHIVSNCQPSARNEASGDTAVKFKKCYVLLQDLNWTHANSTRKNSSSLKPLQVPNPLITGNPKSSNVLQDLNSVDAKLTPENSNSLISREVPNVSIIEESQFSNILLDLNSDDANLTRENFNNLISRPVSNGVEPKSSSALQDLNGANANLAAGNINNAIPRNTNSPIIEDPKSSSVLDFDEFNNDIDRITSQDDVTSNLEPFPFKLQLSDDEMDEVEEINPKTKIQPDNCDDVLQIEEESFDRRVRASPESIAVESDEDDQLSIKSKNLTKDEKEIGFPQIILNDVKIKFQNTKMNLYEQLNSCIQEKVDLSIKQETYGHKLLIPVIKLEKLTSSMLVLNNCHLKSPKTIGEKRKRDGFSSVGPRVKRVCRIDTEILGYPLARFKSFCVGKSHKLERLKNKIKIPKPKIEKKDKVRKRIIRCRKCEDCLKPDCRKCKFCLDMTKYGGKGVIKQACVFRKCLTPIIPVTTFSNANYLPKMLSDEKVKNSIITKSLLTKYSSLSVASKKINFLKNKQRKKYFNAKFHKRSSRKEGGNTAFKSYLESLSQLQEDEVAKSTITKRVFNRRFTKKGRLGLTRFPKRFANVVNFPKAGCIWPYMKMDYDDETIRTIGVALISETQHCLRVACNVCGSTGMENLIYCALCCEPFHSFCLESDEIPSSLDFQNWCCKSCQFCSVCELSHDVKCLVTCHICLSRYHPLCLGSNYLLPPILDQQWCCLLCARCERCGTNMNLKQFALEFNYSVLCADCINLPNDKPCSICQKFVNVNQSRALVCTRCFKHVHCECDNILDDLYFTAFEVIELKDQFICSICSPELSSQWKLTIVTKLNAKLNAVMNTFVKVFEITIQNKDLNLIFLEGATEHLVSGNTEKEEITINKKQESFMKFERVKTKLANKDYYSIKHFMEDILNSVNFENQFVYKKWDDLVNFLFTCVVAACPWVTVSEYMSGSLTDNFNCNFIFTEHNYFQPLPISIAQNFPQQISVYRFERNLINMEQTNCAIKSPCVRVCSICRKTEEEYYKGGRLLFCGKDDWVHINCAIWSDEVIEKNGILEGVFSAISTGNKTLCKGCKKLGATLRCCSPNCDSSYHFLCATKCDVLFQNDKKKFCCDHRQLATGDSVNDKLFYNEHKVLINVNETFNHKKCFKSDVDVSRISILSGSLTVESFGDLYSASSYGMAYVPTNFSCTRVFWSTKNPRKRVLYRCQAILVDPGQDNQMLTEENNITISHESDASILNVSIADENTPPNFINSEYEKLIDEDPTDVYLLYDEDIDEESAVGVFNFLCSKNLLNFDTLDNFDIDDASEKIIENSCLEIEVTSEVEYSDAESSVNTPIDVDKQTDSFFNTPQFKIGEENLPPETSDYTAPITLNESFSSEESRTKISLSEVNFQTPCKNPYANLNTDSDCCNEKHCNCLQLTCASNRHKKYRHDDHLNKSGSLLKSLLENHDNSKATVKNGFKKKLIRKRKRGTQMKMHSLKRCRVIAEKVERLSSISDCSYTSCAGDTIALSRTCGNGNLRNGLHNRKTARNGSFSDDGLLEPTTLPITNGDDLALFNSTDEICQSSDIVTMNNDITTPSSICLSRGSQTDSCCESDQVFSDDVSINSRSSDNCHSLNRHNRQTSVNDLNQLKCPKCRRVYKSELSLQRHLQTCNFEISSSEEDEGDQNEGSLGHTTSNDKKVPVEASKANLLVASNHKLSIVPVSPTEESPSLPNPTPRRRGRPKKVVPRSKCKILPRNSAYGLNSMHGVESYNSFETLSSNSQFVIQSNLNPLMQESLLQPFAMVNDQNFSVIENVIPSTISCSYPISNIHLNLGSTLPVQPISTFNQPSSLTIFDPTQNSSSVGEPLTILPSFNQFEIGVNNISQFVQQPVYQIINDFGYQEPVQFVPTSFEVQPSYFSQNSFNFQTFDSFQTNKLSCFSNFEASQPLVEERQNIVQPPLYFAPVAEVPAPNAESLTLEESNASTSVQDVPLESSAVCNENLPERSIEMPKSDNLLEPNTGENNSSSSFAPHLAFEITSDDGFRIQSDNIDEAWQTVAEIVNNERSAMRSKRFPVNGLKGLKMIGITHNVVRHCLDQLPGTRQHKNGHYLYNTEHFPLEYFYNRSGCARTEEYRSRRLKLQHRCGFRQQRLPSGGFDIDDVSFFKMARRCSNGTIRTNLKESVSVFRSSIHGLGLLCKRNIEAGEQVIEYAGEIIRSILADKREQYYERKRIGCYMFRIDDNEVVDATINGNAARFINHSCEPNCFSKVMTINNKKRIKIFSLRRIVSGEELTYDYKFPIEDVKIPCTCGARKCRKFLN